VGTFATCRSKKNVQRTVLKEVAHHRTSGLSKQKPERSPWGGSRITLTERALALAERPKRRVHDAKKKARKKNPLKEEVVAGKAFLSIVGDRQCPWIKDRKRHIAS